MAILLLPWKYSCLGLILLPRKIQRASLGKGASPEGRAHLFKRNASTTTQKVFWGEGRRLGAKSVCEPQGRAKGKKLTKHLEVWRTGGPEDFFPPEATGPA